MKDKIVIWARNEEDKKLLLAIQLNEKEDLVNIYAFPEAVVTEDFHSALMNKWKKGEEVPFVEGYETIIRPLSVTDDLLPETLKVERPDIITRAKAEWHFVVLSAKLYELYSSELSDIKDKVERMEEYSSSMWEEMKGFWNKVQGQVREKNLFRDHANELRSSTNKLFDKLKAKRKEMDSKFKEESKKHVTFFNEQITELKAKIQSGKSLQPIFEELKKLQGTFSKAKFSRDDRNKIWNKIDQAFKELKEKKYGKSGGNGDSSNASTRLKNRYDGLLKAIDRMKSSIDRDLRDKNIQDRQAGNAGGQLEQQLRQAKMMMIDERVKSKQIKMKDMLATKQDLEVKIAREESRELKRKEDAEIRAKTEAKKAEIKEKMAAAAPVIDAESKAKLEAAAAAIKEAKANAKARKEAAPRIKSVEINVEDNLASKVDEKKAEETAAKKNAITKITSVELNTEETLANKVAEPKVEEIAKEKIVIQEPISEEPLKESDDVNSSSSEDKEEKHESIAEKVEDVLEDVGEAIEDVVDTVKAAASVAINKVTEIVGKITGEEE